MVCLWRKRPFALSALGDRRRYLGSTCQLSWGWSPNASTDGREQRAGVDRHRSTREPPGGAGAIAGSPQSPVFTCPWGGDSCFRGCSELPADGGDSPRKPRHTEGTACSQAGCISRSVLVGYPRTLKQNVWAFQTTRNLLRTRMGPWKQKQPRRTHTAPLLVTTSP